MLRRWLIRTPFFLALALTLVLWITSYFGLLDAGHTNAFHHYWEGGLTEGLGWCDCDTAYSPGTRTLYYRFLPHRKLKDSDIPPTTLGFYVGPIPGQPTSQLIVFPLWLPAIFLAALTWLVWRKTRPKPAGRAFPVEPGPTPSPAPPARAAPAESHSAPP